MDTSAEARVVASFTLIVALFLGAWGHVERILFDLFGEVDDGPTIGRFVLILLPVAATLFAHRSAQAADAAWARTLGGAAVMLGALASLAGVLYFVAAW